MFDVIYIEKDIAEHPKTLSVLKKFKHASHIYCQRYGEIFNRKAQNFRLQKKRPALILAKKQNAYVLPAPEQYSIGSKYNYYFSHMLNCLYDCRYCFLQGMFQSAHYVLFVNYDDFIDAINSVLLKHKNQKVHFFSGYDCDSLAMEPVTKFAETYLPFFEKNDNALIELRTKSTQIRPLLKRAPLDNAVIAFSFTPDKIAKVLEHKTPSINKRLNTILNLQQHGWQIGLRFDPLIYTDTYQDDYRSLFNYIFSNVDTELIHSVSLGSFRLPKIYFKKLEKLFPDEILFASPQEEQNNHISYPTDICEQMLSYCTDIIKKHIPDNKFFPCHDMI